MVELSTELPKYIVVVNSPGSLLWDGRSRFPLHDYVESLTKSRYQIEAIQPIARPRGPRSSRPRIFTAAIPSSCTGGDSQRRRA